MKVCITNGLQPVMLQAGPGGIWTPGLVPETGYCEYRCTLCGRACPTGAIPAISQEQKLKVKLGLAAIDRSICLPWAEGKECIVCQEHCPVSEKAIKLDTYAGGSARPYVDEYLCVGCGICQNKCPVRPARAIRVSPKNADRTIA
ncbi:MAG: 4Fe-4S dicluster domain-containing protein, partial [Candidatus Omnitrophica bacterium]|nr:4Fe-4S dicluster domain-containing protein [Candidatus Omnitrophota bacterium]